MVNEGYKLRSTWGTLAKIYMILKAEGPPGGP